MSWESDRETVETVRKKVESKTRWESEDWRKCRVQMGLESREEVGEKMEGEKWENVGRESGERNKHEKVECKEREIGVKNWEEK